MFKTKRSARLQAKESTVASDPGTVAGTPSPIVTGSSPANTATLPDNDDFEEAPASGQSKRKRATKPNKKATGVSSKEANNGRPLKRRRGQRGLLEKVNDLPVDLWYEVSMGFFLSLSQSQWLF
jgi:hypothetical protein